VLPESGTAVYQQQQHAQQQHALLQQQIICCTSETKARNPLRVSKMMVLMMFFMFIALYFPVWTIQTGVRI